MSEPAGIWIRVSSGGQDEQNQVPDCEKHCATRGYTVDPEHVYTVHGKSASKGKQQADLDRMLADMRAGKFKVLVCWHSDRLERREGKPHTSPLLDLLAEVAAAGGRVESVKEPMLGKLDMGSEVMTFMAGKINAEKSKHLSEQVGIAFDTIKANGALAGRNPFGFTTGGEKYHRVLVPTEDGMIYVPEIYGRVIAGDSLRDICAWLDGKGVTPTSGGRWWPKTVSALIRNEVYMAGGAMPAARSSTSATPWWIPPPGRRPTPRSIPVRPARPAGTARITRPCCPVFSTARCAPTRPCTGSSAAASGAPRRPTTGAPAVARSAKAAVSWSAAPRLTLPCTRLRRRRSTRPCW